MTVVVCDDISHGLVEHREECAQRSQACVVHNVLQLLTILQTLTDETVRHEGWLKHRSTVTLDLHKTMNVYNQPNSLNIYQGSFIHSGHFYSAPSSSLLLRGAPDYSTDTESEFHAEAQRQL